MEKKSLKNRDLLIISYRENILPLYMSLIIAIAITTTNVSVHYRLLKTGVYILRVSSDLLKMSNCLRKFIYVCE